MKSRNSAPTLLVNTHVKQLFKVGAFTLPLIIISCFMLLKILSYQRYLNLIDEDHLIENLEFGFYFVAFAVALFVGVRFFRARRSLLGLLYLILAFGLFFIAMEEISWGQRIFNIPVPEFFQENNYQEEITLHNLGHRPANLPEDKGNYIDMVFPVFGFIGAFAWLLTLMLPERLKARYNSILDFLVPPWYLSLYFFPVFAIYLYVSICVFYLQQFPSTDPYVGSQEEEPAEFLLALGLLLFVIVSMYKQSFSIYKQSSREG
jgi:hypothetical protein